MVVQAKVETVSESRKAIEIDHLKLGKVTVRSGAIILTGHAVEKVESIAERLEEKYDVVVTVKNVAGIRSAIIIPRVVALAKKGKVSPEMVKLWFKNNLTKVVDEIGEEFRVWEIRPVPSFLKFLEKNHKPAYELYSAAFKKYVEWLEYEKGIFRSVSELTLDDLKTSWIDEFVKWLNNPYTANSYLSAFKSLFKFVQREYIPKNFDEFAYLTQYMKGMSSLKEREVPKYYSKEALTVEELAELLRYYEDDEEMFAATVVHFYFGARPTELAYDFAEVEIDLDLIYDQVKMYGRRMVDFEKKVVCLPTAKSKTRIRIIPIDPIAEYFRTWLRVVREELKDYCRPRYWYTNRVKTAGKKLGLKVTAKTARKTFETYMSAQDVKQWVIDYLLGHSTSIPDKYRDFNTLLPYIKETIIPKHHVLKALEML